MRRFTGRATGGTYAATYSKPLADFRRWKSFLQVLLGENRQRGPQPPQFIWVLDASRLTPGRQRVRSLPEILHLIEKLARQNSTLLAWAELGKLPQFRRRASVPGQVSFHP